MAAIALLLMIIAAGAALGLGTGSEQVDAITDEQPAPTLVTDTTAPRITRPPISANDFIPENQDLTTCIGVLERPGCGSESRGGWHQKFVLIALVGGLAVIFGNVVRGVRKRDR